jgi:hypothetical protein
MGRDTGHVADVIAAHLSSNATTSIHDLQSTPPSPTPLESHPPPDSSHPATTPYAPPYSQYTKPAVRPRHHSIYHRSCRTALCCSVPVLDYTIRLDSVYLQLSKRADGLRWVDLQSLEDGVLDIGRFFRICDGLFDGEDVDAGLHAVAAVFRHAAHSSIGCRSEFGEVRRNARVDCFPGHSARCVSFRVNSETVCYRM